MKQFQDNNIYSNSKKIKKPLYKKWWLWVVLFVLVAIIVSIISFNQRMDKIKDAIQTNNYTTAKIMLDEELSKNSEQAKVYLLFADYYVALGQYADAVEILEKGLAKIPSNDDIINKLAKIKDEYPTEIENQIKQKDQDKMANEKELTKQKEESKKLESPKEEIIEITPAKLHKEYDDNAIAADAKYKNKKIKMTGLITDIFRNITGYPYVSLDTGETFSDITAYFNKGEESKVAQVRKGQKITVIGVCKGKKISVYLNDCTFA